MSPAPSPTPRPRRVLVSLPPTQFLAGSTTISLNHFALQWHAIQCARLFDFLKTFPLIVIDRATNDSFANSVVNNTFQQHRTTRSQPTLPAAIQLSTSRPLSSAEESGPATKKIRRQPDISKSHRPVKSVDEPKVGTTASNEIISLNGFSLIPQGLPCLLVKAQTRPLQRLLLDGALVF